MDPIKDAFSKVKEDFSTIKDEIKDVRKELEEIQISILSLTKLLNRQITNQLDRQTDNKTGVNINQEISTTHTSTEEDQTKTQKNPVQTDTSYTTDNTTQKQPFQSLKEQKNLFSIGNEGVSTDRQTDRQTDISTDFKAEISQKIPINTSLVLTQLDSLKKDLRLKIKRLTKQEMTVYSAIYQFEDQGHSVDYQLLSTNLGLSESSIRDYIQRINTKGLPLSKEKINNKRIILTIPKDLRKLATLDTLLKLRNL
jgi:hypothetical protein